MLDLSSHTTLSGAVRHDWNSALADVLTWRFALSQRLPATATRIHASYGKGITDPDVFQLFGSSFNLPNPALLTEQSIGWDAGIERCDFEREHESPRSMTWARFPAELGSAPWLHSCALAYLSDMNAMDAIVASRPGGRAAADGLGDQWMGVSIDHAVWFHRPARADDWLLLDLSGHGLIRTRGLATGLVFDSRGTHVATIAQEGLLRMRRREGG